MRSSERQRRASCAVLGVIGVVGLAPQLAVTLADARSAGVSVLDALVTYPRSFTCVG